jgi:hypothetical protein
MTTNLSVTGAQLVCPAFLLGLLQPALDSSRLTVSLDLPGHARSRIGCAVVYSAHYGDDYLIGLRFTRLDPAGLAGLQRFLLEHEPHAG